MGGRGWLKDRTERADRTVNDGRIVRICGVAGSERCATEKCRYDFPLLFLYDTVAINDLRFWKRWGAGAESVARER